MSQTAEQLKDQEPITFPSAGFAYGIEWSTIGSIENSWSCVWFPADFDRTHGVGGYVVQYRGEPGVFYVAERSTSRRSVIAGPLPTLEAAQLAYLLLLGDK